MTQVRKILTCLDTIFDTRVGTINRIYPAAAAALVSNREYWLREHTDWAFLTGGKITDAQFDEAWAKRDIATCQQSIMTGFHPVFHKVLADVALAGLSGMSQFEVGIEVNLAPYDFQMDEMEAFVELMRAQLGDNVPITFCSIPLDALTPELMVENYAACISYGFHEWIKIHATALTNLNANGFCYIAPKLFERDPRTLTIEQKQEEHARFRLWYMHAMDFEFIDSKHFSMFRPGQMTKA